MRIFIDGQKLPLNVKVTKDLLVTLKSIANTMNWGILYDTNKEVVFITLNKTKSVMPALLPEDRQAPLAADVESTRLLGKTICLDPGHGGSDPGAVGPSGSLEKDNTLAIALLLRDKLERNGARVYLTRDTDKEVAFAGASAETELDARARIVKEAQADIFISIHNDSFTNTAASGTTTYHYDNPESIKLATCVQKSLTEGLGTKNRGARFASFYVIRRTKIPAILCEVAFISNPEEELLLASVDGRFNAAEHIFQGIVQFFKV